MLGILNILTNTVEGAIDIAAGTTKLVVSPVTQLLDLDGESHAGNASDQIVDGIKKFGSPKDFDR
jgi:hypothetical protein